MSTEAEVGQSCSVQGVPSAAVERVWEHVEPLISRALQHSRGELTSDDVLFGLQEQVMQLWIAYDETGRIEACMVTQVIVYPRRKMLRIVTLAGSRSYRWERGWEMVAVWARMMGCSGVEAFARRGIARLYKKLGFREYYSVVGLDFQPLTVH